MPIEQTRRQEPPARIEPDGQDFATLIVLTVLAGARLGRLTSLDSMQPGMNRVPQSKGDAASAVAAKMPATGDKARGRAMRCLCMWDLSAIDERAAPARGGAVRCIGRRKGAAGSAPAESS